MAEITYRQALHDTLREELLRDENVFLLGEEIGNFEVMSYDMGPTLASWLECAHPDVYRSIITASQRHMERYGVSNALAQVYHHSRHACHAARRD